ncbi:MAG: Uma2 family endonuclease [Saprospiraceae bacterium]|nr:Uma2 family endonuclease [Saprospiraceae bacterium]
MTALSTTKDRGSFIFHHLDVALTPEYIAQLSEHNPGWRIERTADLKLVVMPPTNSETGNKNFNLATKLGVWNEIRKLGYGFDSSTGFTLPNGAIYASGLAWVGKERWDALAQEDRNTFAPLAPDFVLELRSPDQSLSRLTAKMTEYMENGVRLAWLIDPQSRQTYVYQENGVVAVVHFDQPLTGGEVLPGFELVLDSVL